MTYLVLARKWRPRSFDTLVGQDHVVRALTHALSTQRLHHAWLFTGTRGVGKTTLSRILAKSLNCEQGITAQPCGQCRACVEIDAGRFVDYVELDAASNRGVDEMTQLLEQAVYAPGAGRFKVYMIDEVHMLTGHAFNAMLKTLEEPPPHVKFILATTDPQKIPVTVLSRCLQFNLKQMTAPAIVAHLEDILGQEGVPFDTPALRLIAQAASGSMRDALSLTDQAIAYSAGELTGEAVQGMLGTLDQRHLVRLLAALAEGSAAQVLQVADELASRGLSYAGALADLAILLSRVAIQQRLPGALPPDEPLAADIADLAGRLHPDVVQLFYTVAVHSRSELALAPDEYAGFVMACLRMLSLAPQQGAPQAPHEPTAASSEPEPPSTGPVPAALGPVDHAITQVSATPAQVERVQAERVQAERVQAERVQAEPAQAQADPIRASSAEAGSAPPAASPVRAAPEPGMPAPAQDATMSAPASRTEPDTGHHPADDAGLAAGEPPAYSPDDIPAWEEIPPDEAISAEPDFDEQVYDAQEHEAGSYQPDFDAAGLAPAASVAPRGPELRDMKPADWPALAARLPVTGLAAELARQSEWLGVQDNLVRLRVAVHTLAERAGQARLCTVLSEHFGTVVRLDVEIGATGGGTAHAVAQAELAERQRRAEQAVQEDPFVQTLVAQFGARVLPGSVRASAHKP